MSVPLRVWSFPKPSMRAFFYRDLRFVTTSLTVGNHSSREVKQPVEESPEVPYLLQYITTTQQNFKSSHTG